MKRDLPLWQFAGFALTALGGTVLHFVYDWSGGSWLTAPFSGVNESTWEHMKLLYFPLLIFALVQGRFFRDRRDFWCVKLRGTLVGLTAIPVLYYTYNGAVGPSPDWLNITIFFVAAALTYGVEHRALRREDTLCRHPRWALAGILLIGALFVAFTFWPPHLPLFRDPITGGYGMLQKKTTCEAGGLFSSISLLDFVQYYPIGGAKSVVFYLRRGDPCQRLVLQQLGRAFLQGGVV